MIDIQLEELDLTLEVAELGELPTSIGDESTLQIQGPIAFQPDLDSVSLHYLDLDLLGFPYQGLSAYEVAVKNGFKGTEQEWLASLVGKDGELGQGSKDAIIRIESFVQSALGAAEAAAGYSASAETYASDSMLWAKSSFESYTDAKAIRDGVEGYALAMTSIKQESEALLTDTLQIAKATIEERVKAETARAAAEMIESRVATSKTSVEESLASVTHNATMAVEAFNQANDRANAAIIAEQSASSYANDAYVEANAANQSKIEAKAARDETNIAASAVVLETQKAKAYADDSKSYSEASKDSEVKADAAYQSAQNAANAAVTSKSQAQAYADAAGVHSEAARDEKIAAEAAKNSANASANASLNHSQQAKAHSDASGASAAASRDERIAAQAARQGAETAAGASLTHSQTAKAHSDASGISASASNEERIKAETAAGQADIHRQASASSASTANGHRIAAQTAETNAVYAAGQAGQSAAAAATTKTQVEALADQTGNIYSVMADRVTVVEGRLQDAEGLITTTQQVAIEARDKINLTYGLELNANNHIVGFKFMNNGQVGEMIITSDKFKISHNSNGSTYTPFAIDGNKLTLTGVVSINGQLIVNGSLYGSALVQDAVTSHSIAYNANTVQLANNTPVRVHGTYINVTKANSPIDILFNCWGTFTHNASGSFIAYVQLVRSRGDSGGTVLCTVPIYGSGMANDTWQGAIPIMYLDTPGEAGNWHYYVQVYFNVNNMTVQSITSRYAKVTELKNNTTGLTTGTGSGSGTGSGGGTGGGGGNIGGGGGVTDPNPPPGGGGGGGIEQPVVH